MTLIDVKTANFWTMAALMLANVCRAASLFRNDSGGVYKLVSLWRAIWSLIISFGHVYTRQLPSPPS